MPETEQVEPDTAITPYARPAAPGQLVPSCRQTLTPPTVTVVAATVAAVVVPVRVGDADRTTLPVPVLVVVPVPPRATPRTPLEILFALSAVRLTPEIAGNVAGNAGAASDRMNVDATPLTAVAPMVAVGFAPAGGDAMLWQLPSPRRNVDELHVPLNSPVTSAAVALAKPEPVPDTSPLSAVVTLKLPDDVTGEPLTEKPAGIDRPTLVTVPEPPPAAAQEPSPRRNVDALHVPVHRPMMSELADVAKPEPVPRRTPLSAVVMPREPAPVTGEPVTLSPVGTVRPTLVTVPEPDGVAQDPSPRRNVDELHVPVHRLITLLFAAVVKPEPLPSTRPFSDVVIPNVPDDVTGEPVTLRPVGTVSPTLVTVPAPAGDAHVPSPRR